MASIFGHALVAYTTGKAYGFGRDQKKLILVGAICSILPDLDVLSFAFGIPYGHPLGHRGLTHSIFFAFLLALALTSVLQLNVTRYSAAWYKRLTYLFICTVSHGALDALTNGGLGVAFLAPFDNTRYFLPWQPIHVSPIGILAFFSKWGVEVIASELLWIALPCVIIGIGLFLRRRGKA